MASNTKFEDISIEQYSDSSIAVRGDTRKYKEDLKRLGGRYNSRLRGEPGWIFPKTKEGDVNRFIKGGQRIVSKEEADAGEARTRERASKRDSEHKSWTSSKPPSLDGNHSIGEYALLVNMLKDLTRKMERMEQTVSILLTPEQKEKLEEKMRTPSKQKSHKKVIKRSRCTKTKKKKVELPSSSSESDSDEDEVELEEIAATTSEEEEEDEVPRKRLLQ